MTAPLRVAAQVRRLPRRQSLNDGVPVEVVEDGPSLPARLVSLGTRVTMRPTLAVLSHVPHLPWPVLPESCRPTAGVASCCICTAVAS